MGGDIINTVDVILKKDDNDIYCHIVTDEETFRKISDAILKYNRDQYEIDEKNTLTYILKAVYLRHQYFYEDIGYEYTADDHPEDSDFSEECWGFMRFLKRYFNANEIMELKSEDLKKLSTLIARRIAYIYTRYIEEFSTIVTSSSTINIFEENEYTAKMEDPETLNDAVLITENGAYVIKLQKTNIKSYKELRDNIVKSIKANYEEQLKAIVNSYKNTIKALKEKINEIRENAVREAINIIDSITSDGWKIEDGYLILNTHIIPDKIMYNKEIYTIPEKHRVFYVNNLHIPLDDKVTYAKCDDAYHPNIDEDGAICLGDLENKDIKVVAKELPRALKTINLDSAYRNSATVMAEKIINSIYLNKDYSDAEVFEVD